MTRQVSLVIPVADEARNQTLPLALASARKYAPWLTPILVGSPIAVEQHLGGLGGMVLPFLQQHPNDPVGNTTKMLGLALDSPFVTDPFVWSNDDIFFRAPADLDDIYAAGATASRRLEDVPNNGRYGKLARVTLDLLRSLTVERPTWNYERHVPLAVNKTPMQVALALGPGGNPRSLYQNLQLDEPFAIRKDVKLFKVQDRETLAPGKFFSTGNRFPIDVIRRMLELG